MGQKWGENSGGKFFFPFCQNSVLLRFFGVSKKYCNVTTIFLKCIHLYTSKMYTTFTTGSIFHMYYVCTSIFNFFFLRMYVLVVIFLLFSVLEIR